MMRNFSLKSQIAGGLLVLFSCLVFFSCSKDSPSKPTHEVVFKAVVSKGGSLSGAVYSFDNTTTAVKDLKGTEWTSGSITAPAGTAKITLEVMAEGDADDATLQIQIYVDGKMAKEKKVSGTFLETIAEYNL